MAPRRALRLAERVPTRGSGASGGEGRAGQEQGPRRARARASWGTGGIPGDGALPAPDSVPGSSPPTPVSLSFLGHKLGLSALRSGGLGVACHHDADRAAGTCLTRPSFTQLHRWSVRWLCGHRKRHRPERAHLPAGDPLWPAPKPPRSPPLRGHLAAAPYVIVRASPSRASVPRKVPGGLASP